jgi:hypothetical protein
MSARRVIVPGGDVVVRRVVVGCHDGVLLLNAEMQGSRGENWQMGKAGLKYGIFGFLRGNDEARRML